MSQYNSWSLIKKYIHVWTMKHTFRWKHKCRTFFLNKHTLKWNVLLAISMYRIDVYITSYGRIIVVHCKYSITLQWRHNGRDGVSNDQPRHCLLNRIFRCSQRKHQSSASLAFVWGIHQWPVNSPHKWSVTRKMFPFDDVIMMRSVGDNK